MKRILILLLTPILSTYCLANKKEKSIVTTCQVQKQVYIHIKPYDLKESVITSKPTSFNIDKNPTGETYSLVLEKENDKKSINLYYESKKFPVFNWNMIEEVDTKNGEFTILNEDAKNLVLNVFYNGFQQQTYYFNLDNKLDGFMTMVNTRWNSYLDSYNNQSLIFCTCKGFTQK
jgi:hypothetical protein